MHSLYTEMNILKVKSNLDQIETNKNLEINLRKLRDQYLQHSTFYQSPASDKKIKNNKMKKFLKFNKIKKMDKNINVKIVKVNEDAIVPTLGTPYSAAFDLYSPVDVVLEKNKITVIDTGLKMEFPPNMCAKILARSGLSSKGMTIEAGLIDNDYRGLIKILICNRGEEVYHVKKGDRVAQLKFEKYYTGFNFEEVSELTDTERNEKGFGSTGK